MTTNRLILALLVAIVIIIGLLIYFIPQDSLDSIALKDTIRFEIIKSLLQLLVITIIGTIIAELFKAREFNRQQALILVDLRFKFIDRLGAIYREVKLVRRDFRKAGLSTKFEEKPKFETEQMVQFYKEKMKRLDELQISLEELKKEAEISPAIRAYKVAYTELKRMEDYLRQVVKESEQFSVKLKPGTMLEELKRLDEFTRSSSGKTNVKEDTGKTDYRFKTHLANSYDNILRTLTK
jgi:hypothetical protein